MKLTENIENSFNTSELSQNQSDLFQQLKQSISTIQTISEAYIPSKLEPSTVPPPLKRKSSEMQSERENEDSENEEYFTTTSQV